MSKSFCINILKPVPKKFRTDRVFDHDEILQAGLEIVYGDQPNDKYHVPVKMRSVYAGMDDVKEYLKRVMPGTDIKNWGIRMGHGCHYCHGDGWSYEIPDSIMETLKRPHIADVTVICCDGTWSISDYGTEWLSRHCPVYITKRTLTEALVWYMDYLKNADIETLSWTITREEMYAPDMLDSICAAYVYAEKIGGVGYIEWE